MLFDKRDPNQLGQEPLYCKGAETDSRAKLGKETLAGTTGGQNVFHIMVLRILRMAQALLRLCSGMLTLSSG